MQKVQTILRSKILLECLHDGNVLNTGTIGGNGTATNVTYQTADRGYQTQDGTYGATSQTTFASTINSTVGIHFRFYPTANTKTLFQYAVAGATISLDSGNAIATSGITSPTVYVNNVQTTAVTLNAWNDVVITYASLNATAFIVGVLSFVGKMGVVRLLSAVPSIQEIQSLYMEGLRKLGGAGLAPLTDGLVAMFETDGSTPLYNVINGTVATYVGGSATTDYFGATKALTNPNYTWYSITYTTGYTFENSGGGWSLVTTPSGLSATGINRTTTLARIFLFSRTLSASEVTNLEILCKNSYPYPF